jgi:hypothetical protein
MHLDLGSSVMVVEVEEEEEEEEEVEHAPEKMHP